MDRHHEWSSHTGTYLELVVRTCLGLWCGQSERSSRDPDLKDFTQDVCTRLNGFLETLGADRGLVLTIDSTVDRAHFKGSPEAFVWTCAKRLYIDKWRRAQRRLNPAPLDADPPAPSNSSRLENAEAVRAFETWLTRESSAPAGRGLAESRDWHWWNIYRDEIILGGKSLREVAKLYPDIRPSTFNDWANRRLKRLGDLYIQAQKGADHAE